ncbi:unnamed protein product [Gordionus sp. m RMFG-2023]
MNYYTWLNLFSNEEEKAHMDKETVDKWYLSFSNVEEISYDDSLKLNNYSHATHCMIYAPYNVLTFSNYWTRAAIFMQIRFDGFLGFPGGLVDKSDKSFEMSLIRELEEEIGWDCKKCEIHRQDHLMSNIIKNQELCLHFYVIKIQYKDFMELEKNCLTAHDYGKEVMGFCRVPLYTMNDGYRGFPAFLNQNFIGHSKYQLLKSLSSTGIMSDSEIKQASSPNPYSIKISHTNK